MINPLTHRKILKKGRPGRATIVASSVPARGSTSFNMAMTLHVFVEGSDPYEVEDQWMVRARDSEALSGSIPVKVDPDDPTRVAIDWDALRAEHAAHEEQRRAALATQGPATDPGTAAAMAVLDSLGLGDLARMPGVQVNVGEPIQLGTAEVHARDDPELRAELATVLGRDLVPGESITIDDSDPALQMRIMQVVGEHQAKRAGAAAPAGPTARSGADDTDDAGELLSRLERLTALRDSGALTPEEFAATKRRLLEDG